MGNGRLRCGRSSPGYVVQCAGGEAGAGSAWRQKWRGWRQQHGTAETNTCTNGQRREMRARWLGESWCCRGSSERSEHRKLILVLDARLADWLNAGRG